MSKHSIIFRSFATLLIVTVMMALAASVGSQATAAPGNSKSATQPQLPAAGSAAPTATHIAVPKYTRKLPPPPGSTHPALPGPYYQPLACLAPVVNVSQTSGNQAESFVVVNPTNPNNVVAFSNIESASSIFRGYSLNGGATWTHGTVATNVACCDGQAAFDHFGNLFLIYISGSVNQVNLILSTDGGVTFGTPLTLGTGSIDQPSIAVGNGSVWVDWNSSGNMVARGAPVTGLNGLGTFEALQTIPGATGSFGGITVGPGPNGGKVMVTYMSPTDGQGPATIYVNVDADGLGAGGFGSQITATSTNVGGFDFIPAQSGRSIDAEPGLVWDATGGPFNNRIYLVYTEEPVLQSHDTDIYLRTSDNDGATWTAPVRVNDDPIGPIRSQFLPYIALDPTSGHVAIGWHDARNDNGVPGSGGTNNTPNDDSEYYASFSTNGGVNWAANTMLSGGFSNAADAGNGVDYGDYVGSSAYGGKFAAVWADNSNCDGTNADGTLHAFDLYFNSLDITGQITHTPTGTPTGAVTSTATSVPTNTPSATNTATTTPIGAATSTATSTATGTATNTLTSTPASPTNTPLPSTGTPPASSTPLLTSTSTATSTPLLTNTPAATNTPLLTSTPMATATPLLTSTPLPSVTPTDCVNPFVDINGSIFYTAIHYLNCHGVINGTDATHYSPGGTATRGQFAKIVVLGFGTPFYTPGNPDFSDVPASYFAYLYIESGYHASILSGFDQASCTAHGVAYPCYLPNLAITRAQLTKLVVGAAHYPLYTPTSGQTFTDVPPSNIFYAFVETAHQKGVINGYPDGSFRPNNPIRRDEMAQIVYKGVTTP